MRVARRCTVWTLSIVSFISHFSCSLQTDVASRQERRDPVPLIFDTDMGNDVDDALALALIHTLADAGEARLLGVTISKDEPSSASYVDLVNTFYGRPDIPIGRVRDGRTPEASRFTGPVAQMQIDGRPMFPHDVTADSDVPEAVALLRRLLAEYPHDRRVVLVVVGFSTNIARLLDSPPDAASPLDGRALVESKVRLLSIMAGAYGGPREPEYNVRIDLPAARAVYEGWPATIVASGFEIGSAIQYPATSIERDFDYVRHHPIKEAYIRYLDMPYDRPCWDLTSVLYAVRPNAEYFGLSDAGHIRVDDRGVTHFQSDDAGSHRFLTVTPQQIERVRDAFVEFVSKRPRSR